MSSPAAFLSDVRATSFVLRFVLLDLFSYCFFNRICRALCRCRAECASLQKPADTSLGKKQKQKNDGNSVLRHLSQHFVKVDWK